MKQILKVEQAPTLFEALDKRSISVNALNYNCDFKRLTQLFGRALQIKYYHAKGKVSNPNQLG